MHYGYHIEIDELRNWLPLLLPVLVLHLILIIVALWDLLRRNQNTENKWMWLLIIILINMVGPILYFIFGRREGSNAPSSSKQTSKKVRKS